MSDRVKQLAQRQAHLQQRCALQRASIAAEVANLEARFGRIDRIAGLARSTLRNPVVVVGGIVALLTVGRSRGMRIIGRLYVLSTAVRRLLNTVRFFQGLIATSSQASRGDGI